MKRFSHNATCAAFACSLLFAVSARSAVSDEPIVIGQSVPLTGPLAEFGADISTGIKAAFDAINAHGGIHGRPLKLVTKDDGYVVARTTENIKALIEDEKTLALLGVTGTPNNIAVAPLVDKAQIPSVAPLTGASAVRSPDMKTVFHLRASYADEAEKIVDYLTALGIK